MQRILVVGGGSIGERHVRCLLQSGRARVALCDPSDDVRHRLRDLYPLAGDYSTLEEAIAGQAWDGAVICAPAHLHVPLARRALPHVAACLIEKPLSTSLEGLAELRAQMGEGPVTLLFGSKEERFNNAVALKEYLESH